MTNPFQVCCRLSPVVLMLFTFATSNLYGEAVVSNVRALQREGTYFVDLYYDLSGSGSEGVSISVKLSDDGGENYNLPIPSLSGDVGAGISNGNNLHIVWDAGEDKPEYFSKSMRFSITLMTASKGPFKMARVPGGTNSGTNPLPLNPNAYDIHYTENYSLTVKTFYMDATEITKEQWDTVYNWALEHGYDFGNRGMGFAKGSDHPVHTVNWFDCVKWCNARSEMQGRTPCYTVDGVVVRNSFGLPDCNMNANGFRLPTNKEWEYAARGGLRSKRFPWGNTISHNQANYVGRSNYFYDNSNGYHPSYDDGVEPFTSPVGSFGPNRYGLFDMAGNLSEWTTSLVDPNLGSPTISGHRFYIRSGSWGVYQNAAFCGRLSTYWAHWDSKNLGFRTICR